MLTASFVWCVTRSEKLSTHCALNAIHDDGDLRATDVAELEALWSEGPGGSLQKDSGTAWQPYDRVGKRCARLGPGVRAWGGVQECIRFTPRYYDTPIPGTAAIPGTSILVFLHALGMGRFSSAWPPKQYSGAPQART